MSRLKLKTRVSLTKRMLRQLAAVWSPQAEEVRTLSDLVPEGPHHPSELCKCDGGFDYGVHEDDCEWLLQMCSECEGTGYCQRCLGDGTEPEEVIGKTLSQTLYEVGKNEPIGVVPGKGVDDECGGR